MLEDPILSAAQSFWPEVNAKTTLIPTERHAVMFMIPTNERYWRPDGSLGMIFTKLTINLVQRAGAYEMGYNAEYDVLVYKIGARSENL